MRFFHGHWARAGGSSFPASSSSETGCGLASSTELLSAGAAVKRYAPVEVPEEADEWCFCGIFFFFFCSTVIFFYCFGLIPEVPSNVVFV